ncbi:MAG: ankyrin repeat domain-containing protein [Lentisphaeria bacterium]|nr:ankyrin repeat domain-containing protein [Lentisphaeria bacterium]
MRAKEKITAADKWLDRPRAVGIRLIMAGFLTGLAAWGGDAARPLVSFDGAAAGGGADQSDGLGQTAVHRAVLLEPSSAAVTTLNQLAVKGADVNAVDSFGNAPLHVAALTAAPVVIQSLLENGAAIDQLGANGRTPLILAVEAGRPRIVEALLKAAADTAVKDTAGRTARDVALTSADMRIRAAFSDQPVESGEFEAERLATLVTGDEPIGSAGHEAALLQLRKLGPAALPPFVDILKDSGRPPGQRRRAAQMLGQLGDKAAIPPLMDTLRGGNERLARAAAEALKALAPHDQAMDICRHLTDVDPSDTGTRHFLYEALGTAGNPEALPFLMHAQATERHPDCRVLAGRAVDAIIGQNTGGAPKAQMAWIKENRPQWMGYFKQQIKTNPAYMNFALFFVIGVVLAGGAAWFIWTRVF